MSGQTDRGMCGAVSKWGICKKCFRCAALLKESKFKSVYQKHIQADWWRISWRWQKISGTFAFHPSVSHSAGVCFIPFPSFINNLSVNQRHISCWQTNKECGWDKLSNVVMCNNPPAEWVEAAACPSSSRMVNLTEKKCKCIFVMRSG